MGSSKHSVCSGRLLQKSARAVTGATANCPGRSDMRTVAIDRDVAFAIAHPEHERLAFTATGIAIVIVPETDDPITIRPTSLW